MEDKDFPEIKTGNGIDRDLTATTNDRLKKAVIEINSLSRSIVDFNAQSLKQTERMARLTKWMGWLTVVIGILTIVFAGIGTFYTKQAYKLSEQAYILSEREIAKTTDPLIQYNFSSEKKSFEVKSGNQTEIREVRWIMPNAHDNTATIINQSSNDLSIDEITLHLFQDISENYNLPRQDITAFIKCFLMGGNIGGGLPLIAEVDFRRMGETETYTRKDFLYIRGMDRINNPYIYIQAFSVSQQEEDNFIKDEADHLKNDYKLLEGGNMASLIGEDGKCRVTIGAPNIFNW